MITPWARSVTLRTQCVVRAMSGLLLLAAACESSTRPDPATLPTPIMFESVRDAGSGLYLMSVDGRRVVPFDVGNTGARTGDWSPGGGQIVFTRIAPRVQVWLASVDGSSPVQLTHSTGDSDEPRWMPNGGGISYSNNDDPFDWGINAVKLDGSDPHRIPNTTKAVHAYSWSPDGRVVFAKYDAVAIPGTGEYQSVSNLYVADTTEAAPVRLSTNTDCGDGDPEWSPDGSKIVFASCAGNKSSIVVVAADGTGRVTLTSGEGLDSRPTWSPDGGQIAFQRGMGNGADVWVMNADGSNAVDITPGNPRFDGVPKWNRARPMPG
jgi:Tol biopolymer transport system component